MSSFCSSSTTSFNQTELAETYPSGFLATSSYTSNPQRDANGLLTSATIQAILTASADRIPSTTLTNEAAYRQKQTALLSSSKEEYCFYSSRYTYALDQLFSAIRQSQSQNITTYLTHTKSLNIKMNDLIQIIIAVSTQLLASSSALDGQITTLQTQMEQERVQLENQSRILQSSEASTKLEKQMIRYTEEKQRYTNNLLKLYSVMNVVALGLLVYVYRATPSE